MHKLAVPRIGWCNPSENYVTCIWRLRNEARVFIVSIVYSIFVLQELEMEPAGVSGTVTISDQRNSRWFEFVASSHWPVVQFLIGLIVFIVVVWSLWQILLKKIVVQHVKNFLEPREQKCRRKMHKNRPQSLVAWPLTHFQWQCSPAHRGRCNKKSSRLWVTLAPSSPAMSPPDFDLYPKLSFNLNVWPLIRNGHSTWYTCRLHF